MGRSLARIVGAYRDKNVKGILAACQPLTALEPKEAVTAVHRLAKLNHFDSELWKFVYEAMGPDSGKLNMMEVSNYVWACGKVKKNPLAADAFARVVATSPDASAQDVAMCLWAICSLDSSPPSNKDTKRLLLTHAVPRILEVSNLTCCTQFASALVSCKHEPEYYYPPALPRLLQHKICSEPWIDSRALANVSTAYVELLPPHDAAQFLHYLLHEKSGFKNPRTKEMQTETKETEEIVSATSIAVICKAYAKVRLNAYTTLREHALKARWNICDLATMLPALARITRQIAEEHGGAKGHRHKEFIHFFTHIRPLALKAVEEDERRGIHVLHAFAASRFYDPMVFQRFASQAGGFGSPNSSSSSSWLSSGATQAMAAWAFATCAHVPVEQFPPVNLVCAPRDIPNAAWGLCVLGRWADYRALPRLDFNAIERPDEQMQIACAELAECIETRGGEGIESVSVPVHRSVPKISSNHQRTSDLLRNSGIAHEVEGALPGTNGLIVCDIVVPHPHRVVIEIEGPYHFVYDLSKEEDRLDGTTMMKYRMIEKLGWEVVVVNYQANYDDQLEPVRKRFGIKKRNKKKNKLMDNNGPVYHQ